MKFIEKSFLFTCLFFLLILSKLSLSAPPHRWPNLKKAHSKQQEFIVVSFKGETTHPGRYHFLQGTTLRDALKQVSLKEKADVSGLNLNKKLSKGQVIRIKKTKGA